MPKRKNQVIGNFEGLRGINVGWTEICPVGEEDVGLTYRGYSIEELATQSTFEEVAYLLIYGHLPTRSELMNFQAKLIESRSLPSQIKHLYDQLPINTHPMAVLRTGISILGNLEPEQNSKGEEEAIRILGVLPSLIGYWETKRRPNAREYEESDEETVAGYLMHMVTGKLPTLSDRKMMDVSLILYAEHEYAASTFAARVCASTLADYHSCITTAIGTLAGPLNGGANEAAIDFLLQFKDPGHAETVVRRILRDKGLIFGFGHAVYEDYDPRSLLIKEVSRDLVKDRPKFKSLFDIAERVEKVMREEKGLFPNLDFYTAAAYYIGQIETLLFTPIFVLSRSSGWAAHILEQRANNKLIRPTAEYIGPSKRPYIPIENR